tara:strand:- start:584 stop:1276 length:693 start_codon:yes stop_codon:yes gene_type:complete
VLVSAVITKAIIHLVLATHAVAAIQQVLAVLVQVVQLVLKQTALLLVVHTKAIIHHVLETHAVAAVDVKLVGLQIAKVHVSQTMYMNRGLATATATMVLIFLPITVVMNAQQVLQFGLTVTSLTATVVTVLIVAVGADALLVKSKIAMEIAAQNHGLEMAIAMTVHMNGTEIRSISTVPNSVMTVVIATKFAHHVECDFSKEPRKRGALFLLPSSRFHDSLREKGENDAL